MALLSIALLAMAGARQLAAAPPEAQGAGRRDRPGDAARRAAGKQVRE